MEDQAKIERLQLKLESVAQQNNKLKQVYGVLLKQKITSNQRSKQFWGKVQCRDNPEYVKGLLRRKLLNIKDTNSMNQSLLLNATLDGSYEITKICLNLNANIDDKDAHNKTPIHLAQQHKWTHIEQLLLFHKNKVFYGHKDKLNETVNKINTQNGIITNIINQLSKYDKITRNFFQDTLIDIMTNIISNKLSFSDLLLNLCWQFESDETHNPFSSSLWQTILKTCNDIIRSNNERDWYWLKTFVIPSTV